MSENFEYSFACMSCLALNLMFIYKINVCLNNDDYVEVVIHVLFTLEFNVIL